MIKYIQGNLIKFNDNLPEKIKTYLEKGKEIKNKWNEDNLNFLINDCINMEKIIKNIKEIKLSAEKNNINNKKINFNPKDEGVNALLNSIKSFGEIRLIMNKFSLKKCPLPSFINLFYLLLYIKI